ncbi:hypothetical protein RFI_35212 [Reticulomyxa filosa]|uniref:Uncharacterized protein n=1 Tax=Reticulomyxa filosa TaxID=46433 RepID=X6LKS3_RETFI|nr:hypothetical protein RFI_35212 [Reticulomyxa filosa]|eukprot:ETO02224.1 hypothetical protein RFI_35212 [Reticulomyxa filosa]
MYTKSACRRLPHTDQSYFPYTTFIRPFLSASQPYLSSSYLGRSNGFPYISSHHFTTGHIQSNWKKVIRKKAHDPNYDGHLGHGEKIENPARRSRGGRYNYFDWDTLVRCIKNCPSVIERDRMPNGHELEYHYKGASIGVNHHGGFDIVAQILNLSPCRSYIYSKEEYPVWIEELRMIEKAKDFQKNENLKISAHRHILPPYLQNGLNSELVNIKGKKLSNNDKRRLIKQIYSKLNIRLHAMDLRKKKAAETAWKNYKQRLRTKIKEEEQRILSHPKFNGKFDGLLQSAQEQNKSYDDRYVQVNEGHKHEHILLHQYEKGHLLSEEEKEAIDPKTWKGKAKKVWRDYKTNRQNKKLAKKKGQTDTITPVKQIIFFQNEFIVNFEILKNDRFNNVCTRYVRLNRVYNLFCKKHFLNMTFPNCEGRRNALQFYFF